MSQIIDVLTTKLGLDGELKNTAAQLFRAEPEGDDEKQSYLKAVEAFLPQLEKLGTKDYFINNPDTISGLKNKITADLYDGVETKSMDVFLEQYKNLIGENDLKQIFSNKSLKFGDKIRQAASLVNDAFYLKEKSLKAETPESFKTALSEKDSVINQLRAEIEEIKGRHEKDLANRDRNYELELLKGDLNRKIGKLPLADPDKQFDLASMAAWNELSSKFHLKRDEKGNILPYQKDSPDLPANDEVTKTALNLDNYLTGFLNTLGLLRRNNGGGGSTINNGADKLPDGKEKFILPDGVNPNSQYAKNLMKMRTFNSSGGTVLTD